ncbi:MAG: hypothetical protein HY553_09085 [Elusimicrobia bacterium]|nr:hypothetical protein [Elusimicrobiota bacterium]
MPKKWAAALVLAAGVAAVTPALRRQMRWAETVNRFSVNVPFVVPIDASTLGALQEAARSGAGPGAAAALGPPKFTYVDVRLAGGRRVRARPVYYEQQAPEGAIMTVGLLEFLRSAAQDPQAEAVALNPGGSPDYAASLERESIPRLIESLRARGLK